LHFNNFFLCIYISYCILQPFTCSSGVTLDDKAVRLFEEMKMKQLHSYFVYHIEDNKVVKVLSRGFPDGKSF